MEHTVLLYGTWEGRGHWRHDIEHNDIHYNDTQHNGHNCDSQHYAMLNGTLAFTLSLIFIIMLSVVILNVVVLRVVAPRPLIILGAFIHSMHD
jgi:hypothetical protein